MKGSEIKIGMRFQSNDVRDTQARVSGGPRVVKVLFIPTYSGVPGDEGYAIVENEKTHKKTKIALENLAHGGSRGFTLLP